MTAGQNSSANQCLIGFSIDGPSESHDAYRVDKGGAPTFSRVCATGIPPQARSGVQHADRGKPQELHFPLEVYCFLKEIGSTYLQLFL